MEMTSFETFCAEKISNPEPDDGIPMRLVENWAESSLGENVCAGSKMFSNRTATGILLSQLLTLDFRFEGVHKVFQQR